MTGFDVSARMRTLFRDFDVLNDMHYLTFCDDAVLSVCVPKPVQERPDPQNYRQAMSCPRC